MSGPAPKPSLALPLTALGLVIVATAVVFSTTSRPPEPDLALAGASSAAPGDDGRSERDVTVGILLFQQTAAGPVLLEKGDHGGHRWASVSGAAPLTARVTNRGERPFRHLALLLVGPTGELSFVAGVEGGLGLTCPVGTDVLVAASLLVGPEPGPWSVVAVFSDRPLRRDDVKGPAPGRWDPAKPGRLVGPDVGAEVVTTVEVLGPSAP